MNLPRNLRPTMKTQSTCPKPASRQGRAPLPGWLTCLQRGWAFSLLSALLAISPVARADDRSLTFSGAGDFVEVTNFHTLGISNEVTVEFWAKTTAAAGQSAFMLEPDAPTNRFQAHVSYSNGNSYWDFGDIGAAGTASGRLQTTNVPGWVGNWTHFALVASQSGGIMRFYANGELIKESINFNDFSTAAPSALRIGGNTGFFYNGSLDEFRVWNVARSPEQILASRDTTLAGDEFGLRLYFKFDDGNGTNALNSATATGPAFNGTLRGNPVWSATPGRWAPVAWTASPISGPAEVSTNGALIGAMNVGGQGTPQTINGVTFVGDPGGTDALALGSATVQFSFADTHGDFLEGAAPGGDINYTAALDSGRYTDITTNGTITLGNLVAGRQYEVQLWIVDTRGCCSARVRTVDGVATMANGSNLLRGIFQASDSRQVITLAGFGFGPQLNLLHLRQLTGPSLPVILRGAGTNGPVDQLLATNGTLLAAVNLGSTNSVTRNGVTFTAAGEVANPAGPNWSTVGGSVAPNLGGFIAIDPLFFSELFGLAPITLTYSNLNPARSYLVQILHGEPRDCCAGTFLANDFVTSAGTLAVPGFTLGNSVAGEDPPHTLDRVIVETTLTGVSNFTYRMQSGGTRGPSIAGFQVRAVSPNVAPSFAKGPNRVALLDSGPQDANAWATAIHAGHADESAQTLTFLVTNDNNALFFTQPAIAPDGRLTFTPATNATGSATVSVRLQDNGGTNNGGVDTSAAQTFTITVVSNVPATGLSIVWVSDLLTNATTGRLPDENLVDLLKVHGHAVTRYNPPDAGAIPPADVALLNAADLVILGRSIGSAAFDTAAEAGAWNTNVTKPLLCMNGYLTRSNRLGWFTGNGIPDGLTSVLNFNNPSDPVSTFILGNTPLTNNTTTNAIFQQIPLPAGGIDRGMSANTDAPVPGATPLAATLTPSNGQFLVSWPAGTVLTGVSTGQVLAGYRMQFLAGNREAAPGPDNTVASAGFNNLTVLGESLFLRAVLVAANGGVVGANWLGDSFGYRQSAAAYAFEDISGTGTRVLTNVDDITLTAPVGFNFSFYGRSYADASFSAKGSITFGGASGDYGNVNLTNTSAFRNLPGIAVLWDDWTTFTSGNPGADAVYYQTLGVPGDRRFIVQWNNIFGYSTSPSSVTFQAILYEATGRILCQYLDVDAGNGRTNGAQATVGIRDTDGHLNGKNRLWSLNQAVITNGQAILFSPGVTEPRITAQPLSRTNVVGTTATFTVGAAGLGTLAYQWQANGVALANGGNISGADTATLVLSNVTATDAARNYTVAVTNVTGRVVSAVATLTVVTPPVIIAQPQSRTNVVGSSVTFSVTTTGTNPRFYQWQTNGVSLPGATNTSYTATNIQLSASGTSYTVVITNFLGTVTSAPAILTVTNATPPVIVTQPQSQSQLPGGSATFSVTAAGSDPKSYQWSRNGAPIPGATGTATTATNVQLSDDGALYAVVVTNIAGSVTSAPATLTVRLPGTFVVTTTNDSGAGSLRQLAVLDAVNGDTITFAPHLSGQTIRLSSGELALARSVTIDASALPNGVTLHGNNLSRLFSMNSGTTNVLTALTLTGGRANGRGGAINNLGDLTVHRCTVVSNTSAVLGGGINNDVAARLTVNQSTFSHNTATDNGGALENYSTDSIMLLRGCTVVSNTSLAFGGGLRNFGQVALENCLFAGNTAANHPDVSYGSGSFTSQFNNLIGNGTGSALTNGVNSNQVGSAGSPIAPLLAPLSNYGGPTPTMPPLPGSPAIDAGGATAFTTDQRGFPRVVGAAVDIGAAEAQTFTATPLTPLTVLAGASATFSTTVSGLPAGEPPVSYEWTKDGVSLPVTTDAALPIFPAHPWDDGTYCVIVSSLSHRVTNCATLTVEAPLPFVSAGGAWKYLADGTDQGTAWRSNSFNDSTWINGVARLGFGGDGEATTIANAASNFVTFYFRQTFTVANAAAVTNLFGQIQVDDGVILYLNGTEIYRRNMTNEEATLHYRSLASITVNGAAETTFWTFLTNSAGLVEGVNVLAAEVHQSATNSSDLGFNLDLVGNYNGTLPPVITVTSPTNAVPYNAAGIPLLVNAHDPEGTVTNVDFYVDGALVSRATNAPFSGLWTNVILGSHLVQALATDNTGLSALSQNQPFTVIPPSVLTTLINSNSTWKYLDDGSNQGLLWRTNTYNDAGWSNGVAELGYGDGPALPEATVIRSTGTNGQRIITTYFRKTFNVGNPSLYTNLIVRLRRDDGGVVYLNGVEVFRSNMTNAPGVPVLYTNLAANAADEVSFFSTNAPVSLLRAGDNLVAVEIHQTTATSSDVSFDLQLQAESGPLIFINRNTSVFTLNWLPAIPGLQLHYGPGVNGPWQPAPDQSNPQSLLINPEAPTLFWRVLAP